MRQNRIVFRWSVQCFAFPSLAKSNYHVRHYASIPTADEVLSGSRRALARAITLSESRKPEHRQQAVHLLETLLKTSPYLKKSDSMPTFRVGISGSPGVGKSTFIEALGTHVLSSNNESYKNKLAVLAVDPSSQRTGGSLLGDKTRMPNLSKHPDAYVRPSPTRGTLGGVTRHTNEAISICESAGYNVIFVETVGVGQSETVVEELVDLFVVLVPPAGGDELQALKKGVIELADIVIVNKADGNLLPVAKEARSEYSGALKLLNPKEPELWHPRVLLCSSKMFSVEPSSSETPQVSVVNSNSEKSSTKVRLRKELDTSIAGVWNNILDFKSSIESNDIWKKRRAVQNTEWMWKILGDELVATLKNRANMSDVINSIEKAVASGEVTPGIAADKLVHEFFDKKNA
eukprot:TRINITY_DN5633_c0_g1_i1.p1 TRINITY_DN5633_c0_g1~~TRINITY_DN5633_c0_g1_i1.p1  ORF type:complete len:404 (+),score=78.91 TRINITY_DN5633_c0_g1_i1:611-1822(+)